VITADTITDEQIRALLADVLTSTDKFERYKGRTIAGTCREALGEAHLHGSTQHGARARCAEILNARQGAEHE
jgi:hypothetical protein